jgi:hypothetical protein
MDKYEFVRITVEKTWNNIVDFYENLPSNKSCMKLDCMTFVLHRLWQHVTMAIECNDQLLATKEKSLIENEQRKLVKERKAASIEWYPRLFCLDAISKQWMFIHTE